MSKNVAVFVDVANIFYAAKAAGVDIDYVTLLKAATAGRDFVRAYAYTGLDPENDNQRQFHGFLARNGYKVISKDIRKYGDGRVKANLDIELVVDMMKTARNLDIAVVVSGDGDFASAIRAVQEMGVRVEVISFRGNTSSDLIEVADLFTDIAQIARVDKSGRSGRRVAAEGDLSMTEVPEKETEGLPRRRRGGRGMRDERPPVVAEREPREVRDESDERGGEMVVLPGERLSRAPDAAPDPDELLEEPVYVAGSANGTAEGADLGDGADDNSEEGRRRRRRRGGRGRGRGRRPEDEMVAGAAPEPSAFERDEEEEFEDLPTAQPPVHAFGSVWDSQLGVPTSASMPPSVDIGGGDTDEDDNYDEPEVPEYLLAERRQRGQQQRPGARGRTSGRGGGGNRSAYQAALDRERFGSRPSSPSGFGGSSSSSGGGNRSQSPNQSGSQGQGQGGNRDRYRQGSRPAQQGGRPMDRGPRPQDRQMMESRPSSSSEPWSEVPPELEEMLRAEMARKQPLPDMTPETTPVAQPATEAAPVTPDEAPAKPARRTRTTKKATTEASDSTAAVTTAPEAPAEEAAPAPAKKPTRSRTTKAAVTAAPAADEPTAATADAADAPASAPAKKPTRRRTTKSTPAAEEG